MKKLKCIAHLIINVISILLTFLFGVCLMTTEIGGEYESELAYHNSMGDYSGQALTDIQNATASTSNNVYYLGNFVSDIVHITGSLGGMILTLHFIKETFNSIEEISVVFKKKQQ